MGKTERLLEMMKLFGDGERVTMPELARRFGVSERTLYRDLKLLAALDCPVRFERGAYEPARPESAWQYPDDVVLLGYCLEYSPLRQYPVFDHRLKKLRALTRREKKRPGRGADDVSVLRYEPLSGGDILTRKKQDRWLRRFVQACRGKRQVVIKTSMPGLPVGLCRPLAVLLTAAGPSLQVELNDRQYNIPLPSVRELRLARNGRCDRLTVEHVRPD